MTKKGGVARLHRAVTRDVDKRTKRAPAHDLGTIQAGGALLLDSFSYPIPKADYLVSEFFKLPQPFLGGGGHSQSSGTGTHEHDRPAAFAPLTAGDRVFVAILDTDSDAITPIVLTRVVDA